MLTKLKLARVSSMLADVYTVQYHTSPLCTKKKQLDLTLDKNTGHLPPPHPREFCAEFY